MPREAYIEFTKTTFFAVHQTTEHEWHVFASLENNVNVHLYITVWLNVANHMLVALHDRDNKPALTDRQTGKESELARQTSTEAVVYVINKQTKDNKKRHGFLQSTVFND